MKKAKKASVKYSAKVVDFLCDKVIEEGLLPRQACNKYPNELPSHRTITQWSKDKPGVKEKIDTAYEEWVYHRIEELEYISTAPISELYPKLDGKDAYEARRARIDVLKFELGKLAPVLALRWNPVQKQEVEVKGSISGPQIMVMNYSLKDEEPKLGQGVVIDHKDD